MDEIDRLAADGEVEGVVVVADRQVRGRGRAGRAWESAPNAGLLCSILLRPDKSARELGALPLIIGLSVADALQAFARVHCQLKWPNDVLVGGKKIAGVLLTSRVREDRVDYVNAGIGI